MDAKAVAELREAVLQALNSGATPSEAAARVGCSRSLVYKVLRLAEDPDASLADKRLSNAGRPVLYAQEVWHAILDVRRRNPTMGPRMLYYTLLRDAAEYGLDPNALPSPAQIGRAIRAAGLSRKVIGPAHRATFPAELASAPGMITVDTWGPWTIRATRVYLITVQDRFTRLAAALPLVGRPARGYGELLKATAASWPRALEVARRHILPEGRATVVFADNGIGFRPAFGRLTQGVRHALSLGARVTFIPPAQPWRNGRLERFHWSMEREYWRTVRPSTQQAALAGLVDSLNYYNAARPHAGVRYRAPADLAPWYVPLQDRFWELEVERHDDPVPGLVQAIRLVGNDGVVDLWDREGLKVSSVLAGQYVRVEFNVTGACSTGRVVYNRKRGEDIVVARFNHTLDAPRPTGARLVTGVVLVDFQHEAAPPPAQVDDLQWQAQRERILKRGQEGKVVRVEEEHVVQEGPGA